MSMLQKEYDDVWASEQYFIVSGTLHGIHFMVHLLVGPGIHGPEIRGTQVKSSGNKNWMNPSSSLDGAYFSETPMSWHVRPPCSLIAIMNY